MAYTFSTNEQLDEMSLPDDAVEVRGFVSELGATEIVGKDKNLQLFKFVLSNGDRSFQCLIWNKIASKQPSLIDKFKDVIAKDQVLYLKGAACKKTHWAKPGLMRIEVTINEGTIIIAKGIHQLAVATDAPTEANFMSIADEEGKRIRITGFLKIRFTLRTHRYKLGSYGLGAITDGRYKVNVTVARFTESELEEGVTLTVTGVVKVVEDGTITVECDSMRDVVPNEEVELMDEEFLFNGNATPKRKRPAKEE